MRDNLLENIYKYMKNNKNIVFLTDDFGSPVLDKIRNEFKERFFNVGIAEQNLINVASGLALEGFCVFTYAIAPFYLRALEQIRINLSMTSQIYPLNVNLIAVGAGASYNLSGVTHQLYEDLSILKSFPNIEFFSPSDNELVSQYIDICINEKYVKYLRLDTINIKSLVSYSNFDFRDGFRILKEGDLAVITTGYMTNIVSQIDFDFLHIDIFLLNNFNRKKLINILKNTNRIITVEEGFLEGGLAGEINFLFKDKIILNIGMKKEYFFLPKKREDIHKYYGIDKDNLKKIIYENIKEIR